MKIAELLPQGQLHAVPLRYLESVTGLSGRAVRLLIERERRDGVPILSDSHRGYFLPVSERERAAFVRSMRGRAGEILRTAEAVESAPLDGVEGGGDG